MEIKLSDHLDLKRLIRFVIPSVIWMAVFTAEIASLFVTIFFILKKKGKYHYL